MQSTIVVGVPTESGTLGPHPAFVCGRKYVDAVIHGTGALAVLLPCVAQPMHALLETVDGLLFTGSYSDMAPDLYGATPLPIGTAAPLRDPARDATTLPLLRAAIAQRMPVLAICRGLQELNVSLGGSLHQALHLLPDRLDHREARTADVTPQTLAQQYGPAHAVQLSPDGLLARLFDRDECVVNSLHGQGIDRLAEGLIAEAVAPDGVVEAVRWHDPETFIVGVQWHPEWQFAGNPQSCALFAAFGDACRRYREAKAAPT